ncbi:MAG: toprim domain-containing protein [Candidatus Paceibacterota bacterium]
MNALEKLTELFRRFPGIGPRQATRFTYFVANMTPAQRTLLAEAIQGLSKNISLCVECQRLTELQICSTCRLCLDESRDNSQLLLVEKDTDIRSIEHANAYTGKYFVLGGSIPVLDENPLSRFRSEELKRKLQNESSTLKEVVLAFSATPQGEHTTDVLKEFIHKHSPTVHTSVLGRGISTGTELEYIDDETLRHALKNRVE